MSEREYATPFPILQAASLLSHKSRITKFRQAIQSVITSEDYVIDLGTGSGILALLAAQQGARVTAVDTNDESLKYARRAALLNNYTDRITFIKSHYADFRPEERADVVICEMLSSVMLIEQQIPASQYAIENLLKPEGRLIPEEVTLYVVPVENENLWNRFEIENLRFPRLPQTVDHGQSVDLGNILELERYDFSKTSCEKIEIDKTLEFEVVNAGVIHGLLGIFESRLIDDIKLIMEDGWRELFLPLPHALAVKKGDSVSIRISFTPGQLDSLQIQVV
jgi:predicted RNA methylase